MGGEFGGSVPILVIRVCTPRNLRLVGNTDSFSELKFGWSNGGWERKWVGVPILSAQPCIDLRPGNFFKY